MKTLRLWIASLNLHSQVQLSIFSRVVPPASDKRALNKFDAGHSLNYINSLFMSNICL